MFIRATKTKIASKKSGDVVYERLKLVENYRTEKGPRQRVVLDLGPLPLKKSEYKLFVKELEARKSGQTNLLRKKRSDSFFHQMVNDAYEKLMRKESQPIETGEDRDVRSIDVKSQKSRMSRTIGPEHVCHSVWNQLKLSEWFKEMGVDASQIKMIEALVIGRLIQPGSELATKSWLENNSGFFDLNNTIQTPCLSSYYRAGDVLFGLKEDLEMYLRIKETQLFDLDDTIVFYDLTNTYLEGSADANPKAKRGKSKEKRSDCKLLTLGLVVDGKGFPKYSKMFSGNESEPKTLAEMIQGLDEGNTAIKTKTIVMDAGIATSDNIIWLKDNGYRYIVCHRGKPPFEPDSDMDIEIISSNSEKSTTKIETIRQIIEDDVYLWCRSPQRILKEKAIRTLKENQLINELTHFKSGLDKPRRTKGYLKLVEIVGRLKERYPQVAKLYTISITPEPGKNADDPKLRAIDLTWEKKEALYLEQTQNEGSYILRTNHTDLSNERIWNIYVMLSRIENAFRNMKSHLGFRPVFHQLENRADAHLFISVLAYHILHIIEYSLLKAGDSRSWWTIKEILKSHQSFILEYDELTESQNWIKHHSKMCTEPEESHKLIYRTLKISAKPFSPRKISYQK